MKYYISSIFSLFIFTSCTKKVDKWIDKEADPVYDTISASSTNRIMSFTIANEPDDSIHGAINDKDSSITIYLPYYSEYYFISNPGITLSKGATISPDMNELIPVFSTEPFVYTVTGGKGEKRNYTVKVVVQQPELYLTEFSTETTVNTITSNDYILIKGQNFVPDFNSTNVYFINAAGYKLVLKGEDSYPKTSSAINYLPVSSIYKDKLDEIPWGEFYIEMESYGLKKRMKYPVNLIK